MTQYIPWDLIVYNVHFERICVMKLQFLLFLVQSKFTPGSKFLWSSSQMTSVSLNELSFAVIWKQKLFLLRGLTFGVIVQCRGKGGSIWHMDLRDVMSRWVKEIIFVSKFFGQPSLSWILADLTGTTTTSWTKCKVSIVRPRMAEGFRRTAIRLATSLRVWVRWLFMFVK